MKKLYIVMPAYNEEMNIEEVARDWHKVVEKVGGDSRLVIVNDGSKDKTFEKLTELSRELKRLVPLTKKNGGHGDTVLYAYNYALNKKADYIFMTDSDGQTLTREFWPFWEKKNDFSVIIGHRNNRKDGLSRVIVTKTLKFILFIIFNISITDANTPFRLMDAKVLKKYINKIPKGFNLSNVMLTVLLLRGKEKILFLPITFRERQGGVNSINLKKIIKIGINAVKDFYFIRKSLNEKK